MSGIILVLNATAQTYTTLIATNNGQASLDIPSNTLAVVTHVSPPTGIVPSGNGAFSSSYQSISVTIGSKTVQYFAFVDSAVTSTSIINNNWPIVSGPATITLQGASSGGGVGSVLCTIQTTPVNQVNFTPNNAVVIPNDSNGSVNVIMESSSDMVNWTPALPGTYGTSYSNRFFRIRATR